MNEEKYGLVAISEDQLTQITIEHYETAIRTIQEYAFKGNYNEIIVYRLSDGVICFTYKNYERGDE